MKKLSILAVAFAAAVGFTSCETSHDDNPVLPSFKDGMKVNFLNAPAMQEQYIDITEDNNSGVLNLTCSQPKEYGYAASVRYVPQISLTEDFADYRQYDGDWSALCSNLKLSLSNIAEGYAEMKGLQDASQLSQEYAPIYVRYVANLYTDQGLLVKGHSIVSNVVSFDKVRVGYLAIWVPNVPQDLYLIGELPLGSWSVVPEYQFHTGAEKNTWETQSLSFPANSKFKLSPSSWNAPFNGAPFNAGNNKGASIAIDADYELYVGSDSGDILCESAFEGVVRLTYKDGKYTIRLIPDK